AMLTAAGRRESNKALGVSWNIVFVALAIAAITGLVSLPAAMVTILIGRAVGLVARYALGTASDRAYGAALVRGIARAGFQASRLVRVDPGDDIVDDVLSAALARTRSGRVYELTTDEGHDLIVVAL